MCLIVRIMWFVVFGTLANSFNILIVFPHNGKSHFLLYEHLFKRLAILGHNVTVISYFPQQNISNYRDVSLKVRENKSSTGAAFNDFVSSRLKYSGGVHILSLYMVEYCKIGMESKTFRAFLKEDNQFDLVVYQLFISECFMGFIKTYRAPIVGKDLNIVIILLPDEENCTPNFCNMF